MNVKELINVSYDENGNTVVTIPNKDEAVIAVCNYIHENIQRKNRLPLDVLFSIVVHFLAMELSGKFEKQFIENIKETTPQYREGYRMMQKQISKPKN